MKIFADNNNDTFVFDLIDDGDELELKENKKNYDYDLKPIGNNRYFFRLNGKSFLVQILRKNGIYHVNIDGEDFDFRVEDERMRTLRELVQKAAQASGEQIITAPIPGLITAIKIKEGDKISVGDGLLILEAMKMENEIKSNFNGIVQKVLIEEGAAVDKDQKLLIIDN